MQVHDLFHSFMENIVIIIEIATRGNKMYCRVFSNIKRVILQTKNFYRMKQDWLINLNFKLYVNRRA